MELKASKKGFPKRIYDTLSSFPNQDEGGTMIFGVSEKEGYDAVGVYNYVAFRRRLHDKFRTIPEARIDIDCCCYRCGKR